jgi:hypothetical protein
MPAEFKQPDDYGLWRFGIINPLLHRTEGAPPLRAQIKELTQRFFYTPDRSGAAGKSRCRWP